jgi:putative ABC transport system permease protein
MRHIWSVLRNLFLARHVDRDLTDDVESFAAMLADEKRAAGLSEAEARRAARLEMGSIESVKEHVRDQRAGGGAERLWQDVRYSWRSLRRTPSVTVVAVVTLTLGIGATSIMFSVVDAALLKPLPFARPNELLDMAEVLRRGTNEETAQFGQSWTQIAQWRRQRQLFAGVEAFRGPGSMPFTWRETGESLQAGAFTAGLPALLGLVPTIGRTVTLDEINQDAPVLVISDALWTRAFGRDAGVIGRTMTLDNRVYTIVGVMPKALRFGPGLSGRADVWTGLADRPIPGSMVGADPVFRLRPGLSIETAEAELDRAAARIQAESPAITSDSPSVQLGFAPAAKWEVDFYPLDRRLWKSAGRAGASPLMMLFGTTIILLIVACANVSNLMVARHVSRKPELTLRAALGATRVRLLRLLIIDGVVLALVGGACAMLLAWWCVSSLPAWLSARVRGSFFTIALPAIDWRVWVFSFAAALIVGVLSSVMPAARESRLSGLTLWSALGSSARATGTSRARRTLSVALQAAQVALSLVLVTGAGLLAVSYVRMHTTALGFKADGLTSISLQLPKARDADAAAQQVFFDDALLRVRAVPGIAGASFGSLPLATTSGALVAFGREAEAQRSVSIRIAGPTYFAVTGIPLLGGRAFDESDREGATPVVIIDERAAAAMWPGQSAIGQRLRYSPYVPWLTVVGVSGWAATSSFVSGGPGLGMYLPASQQRPSLSRSLVVRSAPGDRAVIDAVLTLVQQMEPDMKVTRVRTPAGYLDEVETFRMPQLYMTLMSLFAGLALLTAMVGLYGLLSFAVGQRTREIGVRIALGSSLAQVRTLVLRDALRPVLLGLAAGAVGAYMGSNLLASLLYGVSPRDWRTFAVSALVLVITALIAALGPIRRAASVDPVGALRME